MDFDWQKKRDREYTAWFVCDASEEIVWYWQKRVVTIPLEDSPGGTSLNPLNPDWIWRVWELIYFLQFLLADFVRSDEKHVDISTRQQAGVRREPASCQIWKKNKTKQRLFLEAIWKRSSLKPESLGRSWVLQSNGARWLCSGSAEALGDICIGQLNLLVWGTGVGEFIPGIGILEVPP